MPVQKDVKLNRAKCLFLSLYVCDIQVYWAAYAAKKGKVRSQEWQAKINIPWKKRQVSQVKRGKLT